MEGEVVRTVIWPRRLVISSGEAGGAAMTGHDDDFDSQTRTPITPGCYPRWLTSASLADRALAPPTMHYSVHTTFC